MMQLHIRDAVIDYEIVHRPVKYGRLEFRDGMLRVIVPEGYGNTAAFIEKNTDWIYNKHLHLQRVIALAGEKRLEKSALSLTFIVWWKILYKGCNVNWK